MSQIKLKHSGGNSVIIAAPDSNPASDRTLKLPSDADGTILTSNSSVGKILQVVQTVKNEVVTTTSASFAAISGMAASITPSSASNKILINLTIGQLGSNTGYGVFIRLYKDGSNISGATATNVSSRYGVFTGGRTENTTNTQGYAGQYLDTAGSTSSITYQPYWTGEGGFGTLYLNSAYGNPDGGAYLHTISSITLMEVAA